MRKNMKWIRSSILEDTAEEAPFSTWYDGKDTQIQTTNGSPNETSLPHNSSKTSTNNIHKPQHLPKYKKN